MVLPRLYALYRMLRYGLKDSKMKNTLFEPVFITLFLPIVLSPLAIGLGLSLDKFPVEDTVVPGGPEGPDYLPSNT